MKDIEHFIEGFSRFKKEHFEDETALFATLKEGQNPGTMIIGCSDSRVDPAILTQCAPGEIFIVRNVANLVPPYQEDEGLHGVSAALEYAAVALQVSHIIVLGHSSCGGIGALLDPSTRTDFQFISNWLAIADPVRKKILLELPEKSATLQQRAAEEAALLLSLENLLSFPFILARVEKGDLHLHGWYFDMESGELFSYDPGQRHFILLH